MKASIFFFILLIISGMTVSNLKSQSSEEFLYIGTYTNPGEKGIYVFRFDRENSSLVPVKTYGELESPSFLTLHPNGNYLYSVNRGTVIPDKKWGSVSSYSINPADGSLTHLNDQPTFGSESCHVSMDSKGRLVFVSNYTTGNIVVFPVLEDGKLGTLSDAHQHSGQSVNPGRQEGPHAHCAIVSPDDKHVYVVDLGIDKIKAYEIDYKGKKIIPLPEKDGQSKPGTGPRHITFNEEGNYAYVIEELSSSISVYKRDLETGALLPVQHIKTIPENYGETNYCADIHLDPSGKYLYGSNRGHDSLAIFKVDQTDGKLELIGFQPVMGKWPRNFLVDPKGHYVFVANQNSDNLVIFRINPGNGKLTPTGTEMSIPNPVCVKIL
jgi:6-phosphogluconolactonase